MIPTQQKIVKAIALLLVNAVIQLSVGATLTGATLYAQETTASPQQGPGILSTTGNKNILADKGEVNTGATILDGMTLETSDCVAATVRWGLDEVSLATNSMAVVERSNGQVRVILKQGCASVRVAPNLTATIETPDGKVVTATAVDSSNRKYAQACVGSAADHDFVPACGGFAKVGGIVAGVVGAIVVLALVATGSRGNNPSPSTP